MYIMMDDNSSTIYIYAQIYLEDGLNNVSSKRWIISSKEYIILFVIKLLRLHFAGCGLPIT